MGVAPGFEELGWALASMGFVFGRHEGDKIARAQPFQHELSGFDLERGAGNRGKLNRRIIGNLHDFIEQQPGTGASGVEQAIAEARHVVSIPPGHNEVTDAQVPADRCDAFAVADAFDDLIGDFEAIIVLATLLLLNNGLVFRICPCCLLICQQPERRPTRSTTP